MCPEALNEDNSIADLVLKNGFVYTVDKHKSKVEAIAVREDKIIYAGSNSEAETFIGLKTEDRVSVEEMIASYTINGAFANFLDRETGSLEVGKKADIVVLDKNLFEIAPSEISKTKVLMTIFEGKEVYKDKAIFKL